MTALLPLYNRLVARLEALSPAVLPTLARFVFTATLFLYYWSSALTKLGDAGIGGLFSPTFNAFAQIFPGGPRQRDTTSPRRPYSRRRWSSREHGPSSSSRF
jgi:hypothetical protein